MDEGKAEDVNPFVIALIILNMGAAGWEFWQKHPWVGGYWIAAAVLNFCVMMRMK